jgi:hypothetical protein
LSGDIDLGTKGIAWAKQTWPDRPVLYVAGNHEYYRRILPVLNRHLQEEAEGSNVHVLENTEWVYQGVRFLGCVLWTDFDLFGPTNRPQAMDAARNVMADYRVIQAEREGRRLQPEDTRQLHLASRQFLEEALARPFAGPTVIITHHAPSQRSSADWHRTDLTNAAFTSNLDDLITQSGAVIWIHGHTHYCVDYRLGNTRVLSNQRGYPNEEVGKFDAGLVVEV